MVLMAADVQAGSFEGVWIRKTRNKMPLFWRLFPCSSC